MGRRIDEALANIEEAILLCLGDLQAQNQLIPDMSRTLISSAESALSVMLNGSTTHNALQQAANEASPHWEFPDRPVSFNPSALFRTCSAQWSMPGTALRLAQDRPFDWLRIGPSTGSG